MADVQGLQFFEGIENCYLWGEEQIQEYHQRLWDDRDYFRADWRVFGDRERRSGTSEVGIWRNWRENAYDWSQ